MKTLLIILTVAALVAGGVPVAIAQSSSADVVVIDGLALPRNHQYESYDVQTQKYSPLRLEDVPGYARSGQRVYDRTAKAWVVDPSGKIAQRYLASGSTGVTGGSSSQDRWDRDRNGRDRDRGRDQGRWDRTTGTVASINGDEVVVREDGGRQVTVNMSDANTRLDRGLKVGDRISVMGEATRPDYIQARAVRERRSGDSARGSGREGQDDGWARIHGRIDSIDGNTLRLRADDGRNLTVDIGSVSQAVRQGLTQGERVTVIGHDCMGNNRLRAEYVQQDSSDPSRGGSIAPSASPKGR
jgi:hypothetical protein